MTKQIIIVNPKSNNAKKVIRYLDSEKIAYYLSDMLKKKINEGFKEFVICGGDGTINRLVNLVMKLPEKERSSIKIGIVPCGRANDLARYLDIPLDVRAAFERLDENNTKRIDLIKVNDNYVITGGGIGLPSETVEDVDNFSTSFLGKYLKKPLGDSIYFIFTMKKFIFGYKGVEIMSKESSKKHLAIYVLNQPFIGKRFYLAPEAKNDDGQLHIKIVEIPPTFGNHFKTLTNGLKGDLDELKWVKGKKSRKIIINLNEPLSFMGDGELLKPNKKIQIEIVPKAITIFH
jgi:diacylglycerol kinase (ATP)